MRNCAILILAGFLLLTATASHAQSWDLVPDNIDAAIARQAPDINADPLRPAFHLTPPAGCMGDPNGGIFHDGWYHIFYGQQPFAWHPGGWYWAHARSKDLLSWEDMGSGITPPLDMGLNAIGSGSTIVTRDGKKHAFHSNSLGEGGMKFWHALFTNDDLSQWEHSGKNPILTLDYPGLPPFHGFWRDPFVFAVDGRTFLIACADLLEEDYVPVPIFEAKNDDLTDWDYKGLLFTYPKHKLRNLEVPELRPLGDKWIFLASCDAPVDRCVYFVGDFDLETLRFTPATEGVVDYSGHYYAQETILDDKGELYLMAWMPGHDRDWLPTYMNEPPKNDNRVWNGCFALPRRLSLDEGDRLIQQPVESLKQLRGEHVKLDGKPMPVDGSTTAYDVLDDVRGDQVELLIEFDLGAASFCGLNVLCDDQGKGGLFIAWSGDILNVDGVKVPMPDWKPGRPLRLHIFIDKMLVETFINNGQYTVSRQVRREHITGDRVALTTLGGTARLLSLEAWKLNAIK